MRRRLEEDANELRAIREEIAVQIHLGKLEAKERWAELEKKWQHAEGRIKQIGEAGREAAEDVGEATQIVLDELRNGYEKLKRML